MAVWGRAITVLAISSALAGLTACEYADDGDPRPSAVASSSPAVSAPAESTPDPEQEKRLAQMYGEVNSLLGKPTGTSLSIVGPIGSPAAVAEGEISELPSVLTGGGVAEPGQYTVKVACVGDTRIRFTVRDGDGTAGSGKPTQPESLWIPCGSALVTTQTLKTGWVLLEIQGEKTGIDAAGGIQVLKAPAKAAPKP